MEILKMFDSLTSRWFKYLHSNHIIYNTCWEDPRLDRVALNLNGDSKVLVLTSAGCNALDYALAGAGEVFAVDVNPKQNALLELKLAAARTLDYEAYFELFGKGKLVGIRKQYFNCIRSELSAEARSYWDHSIDLFDPKSSPAGFYFRGTSGFFAKQMHLYLKYFTDLRPKLDAFLLAPEGPERKAIYYNEIKPKLWSGFLKFLVGRQTIMAFLGVPKEQQHLVENGSHNGMFGFIESALDAVFGELNFGDNYFWRLYLTGSYLPTCCPEYLKYENFSALQNLCERVHLSTNTVSGFLREFPNRITHFVLLDHMDWLAGHNRRALAEEWQQIVNHAAKSATAIWRSGATTVNYVNPLRVQLHGQNVSLGELIKYNTGLAADLHRLDRVHTYGSFYIGALSV